MQQQIDWGWMASCETNLAVLTGFSNSIDWMLEAKHDQPSLEQKLPKTGHAPDEKVMSLSDWRAPDRAGQPPQIRKGWTSCPKQLHRACCPR